MSEENEEGFPGVQVSTFITGDQFVFRAKDGDELAAVLKNAGEAINDVMQGLNSIKQGVIAKAIFSGDSQAKGAASTGGPKKSTGARAKDSPPPGGSSEGITFFDGEDGESYASIECKHGPMKDLRGRGFKKDLYCTLNTKNYKDKCEAVKL